MTTLARTQQLTLPGFKSTAVGLLPNKTITQDQWDQAGYILGHIEGRLAWYIGDWLLAGESTGYLPQGKLAEACEQFGIAYSTATHYAATCRAFDQSCRRRQLSFNHHTEAANRDDAEELLGLAEREGLSVSGLRQEMRRRSKALAAIPPPKGKYRVIYADPPWEYGDERTGLDGHDAAVKHYPTMSIDALCDLPIVDLSHENAVLFMWTTSPLMDESLAVIEAWGFEYKAQFVWDKVKHNLGHYVSVRHELLLICTRGSCTPDSPKLHNSVQRIERKKHSEKPTKFYEIIESMYTTGPYLELFARTQREGWKAWGNQVPTR
jgi:N6-adenosine-specific RNA methylase IME4